MNIQFKKEIMDDVRLERKGSEELKTLKDLEFFDDNDNQIAMEYNVSVKDVLKAEAIKWVNALKGEGWDENQKVEWIKHFFNITEEELKK